MSDGEIRLGEVTQASLLQRVRPDRDPHYVVVGCSEPRDTEVAIYVDLDTMQAIESHAASDTQVELGGVLLGGQFLDDQGLPFVMVEDLIPAENYIATKGSFKFTHETWEAITRRREEFPDTTAIVGWYHTHPEWGIFLSQMDLFICRNFFARPLDLALVIDPCREERGWFCWSPGKDRPERARGFYLYTSRFRVEEATKFARSLEGAMSATSASTPVSPSSVPASPTVIAMSPPARNVWLEVILALMIGLQSLIWAVLLVRDADDRLLSSKPDTGDSAAVKLGQDLASQHLIERLMVEHLDASALAELLPRYQREIDDLQSRLDGQVAATAGLAEQLDVSRSEIAQADQQLAAMRDQVLRQSETLAQVQRELDATRQAQVLSEKAGGRQVWYRQSSYLVALGGSMVLSLMAGVLIGFRWNRRQATSPNPGLHPELQEHVDEAK